MRVYISADLEGIAGVANLDQVVRGAFGYARAQQLMTAEVNAAIEGAFEGGATSVVVNDSHGTMDNLLPDQLDPRARLVFGAPKAQCMAQGLTPDFDVAFFVGYHAAAGSPGVLAHSFSSHFLRLRLNGAAVSEADVNALYAASQGVPIGLVTGDKDLCKATATSLPEAVTVCVKEAEGWSAIDSVHPVAAATAIRSAAARAVQSVQSLPLASVPARLEAEVEMSMPTAAELAAQLPGSVRVSELTVRQTVDTPAQLLGLIVIWSLLAGVAARERIGLIQRR